MNCNETERRLLESIDGQVSRRQRVELNTHLAGCRSCQARAQDFQHLDTALTQTLRRPALSPNFANNLQARIASLTPSWSEDEQRARKQRVQRDFEAGLAKLHERGLYRAGLADVVGTILMFGLATGFIWQIAPWLVGALARFGITGQGQTLAYSVLAGALFAGAGLAVALTTSARTVWARLEG